VLHVRDSHGGVDRDAQRKDEGDFSLRQGYPFVAAYQRKTLFSFAAVTHVRLLLYSAALLYHAFFKKSNYFTIFSLTFPAFLAIIIMLKKFGKKNYFIPKKGVEHEELF
jgi:hypothetical protein